MIFHYKWHGHRPQGLCSDSPTGACHDTTGSARLFVSPARPAEYFPVLSYSRNAPFMSPGLEAIAVFSDSQVVCFPLNCGRCRMQLFTWLPLHEWHVLSSPHYWAHKNFTDVMGSCIFETFLSHSLEYMSPDKACSVLPTPCSSGPISKMLLI